LTYASRVIDRARTILGMTEELRPPAEESAVVEHPGPDTLALADGRSHSDVEALKDGATLLMQAGNRVAALALLWSAVAVDPLDLGAHRRLAAMLANAGDLDGAANEYARYVEFLLPVGDVPRATLELSYGVRVVGGHPALRDAAEKYARAALHGTLAGSPWTALLDQARTRGDAAAVVVTEQIERDAELLPDREARRLRKEGETTARRAHRRAHAATIDHGLQLASLWLRDVAVAKDGVPELIHHTDRAADVRRDAEETEATPGRLRDAIALIEEARTTLILNPSEELVLEALVSRVERVLH
jgi:hypothetical protein